MLRVCKAFIIEKVVVLVFFLCLLSMAVCAQDGDDIQLYNRNEKVQLSESIIEKNGDYFISVDDLDKINIQYKFTESDNGFVLTLFSQDCFGLENKLSISVRYEDIHNASVTYIFDDEADKTPIRLYHFSNSMRSKKTILLNSNGMQVVDINLGYDESVIIEDDKYYISLNLIARAISYDYSVNDNTIKLWITDPNHHMINGNISLPEGEVAGEYGMKVNVLVLDGGCELTNKHTLKSISIPQGENKVYYYVETDVSDKYNWLMFEFDGNYKTINEFVNVNTGSRVNISTTYTEKKSFYVSLYMPSQMEANEDIYANIILEKCAVYNSTEPIIRKGAISGGVTLSIDKDFVGKIAFSNISGDNRIYSYGYFDYPKLKLLGNDAGIVTANKNEITATLMKCYEISGQVVPMDLNRGYKVRVLAETDSNVEICLTEDIEDDFLFNIKVPESVSEYTLSVAYKPGVYSGYVSDGVSTYLGDYYIFENNCNYSDIRLKYEPYLPDLPIEMNISSSKKANYIGLKNISDELVVDSTLYCACYREGKLINLNSIPIDRIMVYSGYKSYESAYPAEFYKADEVKVFLFNDGLRPLSLCVNKKVNEPYYPDDKEFSDVNPESKYYDAIKDMYLSGVCLGYENDTFHPEEYFHRSEAAVMLCRLMGYWGNVYDFSCADVPESNWESSYVGICVNEGVFELEDGKFRPYEYITLNETCEAIVNILKVRNAETYYPDLFINIDTENMERCITRAEFAQLMYNYKRIIQ